ncbi:MAG: ATP-binding cassette domain-containing protein, partial [Methylococcales bacterium]|nr:ATP-binding cassette domain-containing protein [Methylococcales bacterium]
MTAYLLQGSGLSCIRDDRVLFSELNFQLNAGQILLLEGKNGSGKTSLLRILCGFREPDAGEVRWGDEAINDSAYYADMAYIGHLDGIKKELTVLENLKVSLALGVTGQYSISDALTKVHL